MAMSPEMEDAAINRAASQYRIERLGVQTVGFASGQLIEIASKSGEMAGVIERDSLPEPWDLVDHVGNFTEAGMVTTAAMAVLDGYLSKKRNGERPEATNRDAAIGAFVISSAVQIVGEKYGHHIGMNSVPDMVDAAYGIGFSGVVAFGLYKGHNLVHHRFMNRVRAAIARSRGNVTETRPLANLQASSLGSSAEPIDIVNKPSHTKARVSANAKRAKTRQQKNSRRRNR